MLSVLIPTYNHDITPLVKEIHEQCLACKIDFEILVYDDGSKSSINKTNNKINSLKNCTFKELPNNIGRSAIRNLLALKANFEWLLFIDVDTKIINKNFIKIYLNQTNYHYQIIYGGISYESDRPQSNKTLRWVYGKKREALDVSQRIERPYLRFLTLNFLIKKDVFNIIKFNINIPNLRHEDTLFSLDAKRKNIKIAHINNPVLHIGIETNKVFLKKTDEALDVLCILIKQSLLVAQYTKLTYTAQLLIKYKLHYMINVFYLIFKETMRNQLLSKNPSLIIFDFYRLGYYLNLICKK